MKLKELSDFQIYALYQNKNLSYFLKKIVDIEFTQRHFSIEYQNKLSEEYQKRIHSNQYLTFFQKVLVLLLTPFIIHIKCIYAIYLILIYWFVLKGHSTKVKQFWLLTGFSCLFWLIFTLFFAKFYLFSK